MKTVNIFLVIILSCIILSCGDDPVKTDIKPEPGKIKVFKESTGISPDGYYTEVYQILKESNIPEKDSNLTIYTNPSIDAVVFRYSITGSYKSKITISNPITNEIFNLFEGAINPGKYSQTFILKDSSNIKAGMYTAYLYLNNFQEYFLYDTLNIIYYPLANSLLFENKSLYLLGKFTSELPENTITIPENYYNLTDKKINITNYLGIYEKTVIYSDSLKIKVFNKVSQKIGEINTTIEELKNTGILIKI